MPTKSTPVPRIRYRYSLRLSGSAQPLSRHRTVVGALDAVAEATSRSLQAGEPAPDLEIWDHQEEQAVTVGCWVESESSGPLLLALTPSEKTRLRELAAEHDARAVSGRYVGRPSITRLLRLIVAGELRLVRQ